MQRDDLPKHHPFPQPVEHLDNDGAGKDKRQWEIPIGHNG